MSVVALMYHALHADAADLERIDAADRPYAVSADAFAAQLDRLAALGLPVIDPAALERGEAPARGVLLTFDDGHASNFELAFPLLRARGHAALFFVTSDFIGRREGFCTWPQLGTMAAAGMRIGGHGRTHRFFEDLDDAAASAEFRESHAAITAGCGRAPAMMSFPGGRFRASQLALGAAAGYRWFFTSEPGANSPARLRTRAPVRRVPVRATTGLDAFAALASASPAALWPAAAVAGIKRGAQRVLGNRAYHALYERLARR